MGAAAVTLRLKLALCRAQAELRRYAAWDESQHPRQPTGSEKGGEFAPADAESRDRVLNDPAVLAQLKVPSVMYHVTHKDRLAQILREGLRPGQQRGSSLGTTRGVYLTDSPDDIGKQGGDIVGNVVLQISTRGLNLRLDPEYFYYGKGDRASALEYVRSVNAGEDQFALYSRERVPRSAIKVM